MELIKIHASDKDPFIGYAESRIGGRSENQDSFSFAPTHMGFLVTVCDGMGGGPGGKTASGIAVTEIVKGILDSKEHDKKTKPADVVKEAVEKANAAIYAAAEENSELHGMGSTATVLLLAEEKAIVAHVGDSRVYQLRGHRKIFRTFDHSKIFEEVREERMSEEQARLAANSNVITRALGVKPEVEVEIHEVSYEAGDRFMLCTDGIHGSMEEKQLLKMATEKRPLGVVTDNIATTVDEIGRMGGGGHDNLTIAMLQVRDNSKKQPEMPQRAKDVIRILGGICIVSIVMNVVQCACRQSSSSVDSEKVVNNELKQQDKASKDSIAELKASNKVQSDSSDTSRNEREK